MKRIFIALASVAAIAAPAAASAQHSVEGLWENPKHSVVIKVANCGTAYCGTVVRASPKAKKNAREAGTDYLVGTQILSDVRPDGKGGFKGRAFVPKHNVRAGATIRWAGPDAMLVKGCVIGIICKEQRWTRVSR
jgi:uncharacterized protein (DUF2147 family)